MTIAEKMMAEEPQRHAHLSANNPIIQAIIESSI
jgi:hypothetical protein